MPTFGTSPVTFGAIAVDRAVFRRLLPDARWLVYAAGWCDPGDGNDAIVELIYERDDESVVVLGAATFSGAGRSKRLLGPVDLFATSGVPAGEAVPMIRLRARKTAGLDGSLDGWVAWLRLLPALT